MIEKEASLATFFPEFKPMRSFILQNFRSDNDRPKFYRWLYKMHVPEMHLAVHAVLHQAPQT